MVAIMNEQGFALFDTPIGRCGIAWGERGIIRVQLPEADARLTRERLLRHCPAACEAPPPLDVQRAVDSIVALLGGDASELSAVALDLSDVRLDMERVPELHRRVYAVARTIPPGATLSYGEIAARLGEPGAAREVGQALGQNPFPLVVPCHRVVAAGGKLGGFSARGGVGTKLRLLALEGVPVTTPLPLFDDVPTPRSRA